jgi:glycine dehydrogenase
MSQLPFDPKSLKRELCRYYITATNQEIDEMLKELNITHIDDLYSHIDNSVRMNLEEYLEDGLEYDQLQKHIEEIANKNRVTPSFIGDGLHFYKVSECVVPISNIRGLTTAYTPYQPERSQGTLIGQWIYASALANITGFEAINASLYDRSTALFEALNTSTRLQRRKNTVIVTQAIQPQDLKVIHTLADHTTLNIVEVKLDANSGTTNLDELKQLCETHKADLAAVAFAQVNNLGLLEDVNTLTDLADEYKVCSIAVVDPILMGEGGLLPPSQFGTNNQGTTMFVAEGQQMTTTPNFGGPGLGIFGIRYNEQNKTAIRSTPGRYVGKTVDQNGEDCLCMVLSTREQHIRREKATSNICSNQAFASTLCGAALLERGSEGLKSIAKLVNQKAKNLVKELTSLKGVSLAFDTAFFNQFTLRVDRDVNNLINLAAEKGIEIGINVSERVQVENALQIFVSDYHSESDINALIHFFKEQFADNKQSDTPKEIGKTLRRVDSPNIRRYSAEELVAYYKKLGALNLSPDDNLYPLGSCTMKYNPYINDYAANLKGFTHKHPQAPEINIQGSLEILYKTQELFKKITGLHSVATQPVAGAHGELTGIKMFQAYHKDRGEIDKRQIIILPKSAHGTNPATAAMAGFETKKVDGVDYGIVSLNANSEGEIDIDHLKELLGKYDGRVAGIMITNPNTSGIFETHFKEIADLIHQAGGLMYMDGANMNAIAGRIDLGKLGVDAVHNNLHKTWSISHGGGGPGDAIVAVSEKLAPYIVGTQVQYVDGKYSFYKTEKSIGEFHRHHGNFAHKVRCYTYLMALGGKGIKQMSGVAVLSARYLYKKLQDSYPTLPHGSENSPRMHEFILTLEDQLFTKLQERGISKAQIIPQIGKLFLDFGIHAPTVAFPEPFGLMIEPTESFSKAELDKFIDVVRAIKQIIIEHPEALLTAPHFTAIKKVNEVEANKNLMLYQSLETLPKISSSQLSAIDLQHSSVSEICGKIVEASAAAQH